MRKNQKKLHKRITMKKYLLLLTIFFNINTIPNGQKKVLAIASIGFLSRSIYCGVQAAYDQMQLGLDTHDSLQRAALVRSRNFWLKEGLPIAVPGIVLLRLAEAQNTKNVPIWPFAVQASALFAMAGTAFKESLRCHNEFKRSGNLSLAAERNKWRCMSALTTLAGLVFCIPVVSDCE